MKAMLKLYRQLCDEYNDKGYYKLCSLQNFLYSKYSAAKTLEKKSLILDVINYSRNDF